MLDQERADRFEIGLRNHAIVMVLAMLRSKTSRWGSRPTKKMMPKPCLCAKPRILRFKFLPEPPDAETALEHVDIVKMMTPTSESFGSQVSKSLDRLIVCRPSMCSKSIEPSSKQPRAAEK